MQKAIKRFVLIMTKEHRTAVVRGWDGQMMEVWHMLKSPRASPPACRASKGTNRDRIGLSIPHALRLGP